MVKKALLIGVLMASGAVALVSAQDRSLPSILSQPAPRPATEEPRRLTSELQQVQQQVASQPSYVPQTPAAPARLPASAPAYQAPAQGVRPASMTQDPAVPAILSGRPAAAPAAQQLPSTTPSTTPPATTQTPSGSAPRQLPGSTTPSTTASGTQNPAQLPSGPMNLSGPAGSTTPAATPQANANTPATAGTTPASPAAGGIAMTMRGPTLRVDVNGPSAIAVGKASTYEVLVSNPGQLAASTILVAVDFPAFVTIAGAQPTNGQVEQTDGTETARVIWTVDGVAAGGQQKLTLQLTPTQNTPFDLAAEWTVVPLTGTARIEVTQPVLAMTVSGPSEVLFGETATFKFDVTNSGTGAAENVQVRLPEELGGDSKPLGTVPAGESRSFVLEVTPVEAGEMVISATATADGGLMKEAAAKFITRRGNLVVDANGPEFKYAGTVANYDIVIRNSGDAMATDVIAAAALPEGAEYIDGIEGGEQVEGGVRWTIGQLAPNEERTYSIRVMLTKAGSLQFETGARGAGELAGADAVETLVEAVADLTLNVEDPQGPKPIGEEVTYTLHITNRGLKQATDVRIVCQFSEGIEPTRVVGQPAELAPGQVIIQPIARIDAGQEIVIEVKAKASKGDNLTFRAELTCENPQTRRLFEGTTRFFSSSRTNATATTPSPRAATPAAPTSGPTSPPASAPSSLAPRSTPSSVPSTTPSTVPSSVPQASPALTPAGPTAPANTPSPVPAPSVTPPANLTPPANGPLPSLPGGGSFRSGMLPNPGSGVPR